MKRVMRIILLSRGIILDEFPAGRTGGHVGN